MNGAVVEFPAPVAQSTRPAGFGARALSVRRAIFFGLNAVTVAGLFAAMAAMMAMGGLSWTEGVMLFAYALTLPWLSIGFWNGVIGFAIALGARDPASFVNPAAARTDDSHPITARTAIAMAIRNEDVAAVIDRLEVMHWDLVRSGWGDRFAFHILSDTIDPAIARAEEEAIVAWQNRAATITPIHYRRRTSNEGFKAGNIAEFCAAHHADYDFFLPLDADSRMSAKAILRLVRIMQASPEIGILQGLVVGSPSRTFFTRAFQFGMRHGMRSYTLGAAWWQGDCGPFWGHNALIRLRAFHEHCRLPVLPGRGPLSGHIMSHDQVEAVLMRRGGYEVRVLAEEDESFEENPPSLPDFIKRESRWCQGNMQYLKLLGRLPGLKPASRVQLLLAIMMYVNGPAWFLFITMGAATAVFTDQFGSIPIAYGLGLFALIMLFNLTPKFMGMAQSFWQRPVAETYGGRARIAAGLVGEFLLSSLIAPCVAFAITICSAGLLVGKRIRWDAQQRSRDYLSLREAARTLWPQTLYGLALLAVLGWYAPWALAFGCLIVVPLCLAIPLATGSTLPALGRKSRQWGLFDIPEDRAAWRPPLLDHSAAQAA